MTMMMCYDMSFFILVSNDDADYDDLYMKSTYSCSALSTRSMSR